jgi:hypothetical protein
MVYHQVARSVVRKESGLKHHDGVAMIKSVDGLGHPGPKTNTYRGQQIEAGVRARRLQTVFTEDRRNRGRLMTPPEVLGLTPRPEYVMYE